MTRPGSVEFAEHQELSSLSELLDRVTAAGDPEQVSVQAILDSIGPRSFGPLLLAPSAIIVSPLSGIPGLPTMGAVVIVLIAGQLLIGRRSVWLPQFILRRSIDRGRLRAGMKFLRPVARFTDRLIRPRLVFLTRGLFSRIIAAICILIALMMPPLELVPMGNTTTAAAIGAFGLALVGHDGALAIAAFAITAGGVYLGISALM